MSNDYVVNDDIYLVLMKYFDSNIENIDKKIVDNLKKGKYKKQEIKEIDKKIIKTFKKIIKLKEEKQEDYANINWIYPEWSKDEKQKKEKLKEYFPEDYQSSEDKGWGDVNEPPSDDEWGKPVEGDVRDIPEAWKDSQEKKSYKSIIPQRKAFIDWVNENFYKELITLHKEKPVTGTPNNEDTDINIYQYFVKKYLSIETPFRGLLVYHGLGTGKTATSVVTAEGLSKKMPIYTFLPASLETEYIKEVKSWGDKLYKLERNNWVFYPFDEIKGNLKLRRELKELYGIEETHVIQIFNKTKNKLKKPLNEEDSNYSKELSLISKKLNEIKGIFIPIENAGGQYRKIYTMTGSVIDNDFLDGDIEVIKFENHHIDYISEQINTLVKIKYNFIHYNGFPRVEDFDFKNNSGKVLEKPKPTDNDKMVLKFAEDYKYNYENFHIESPFKNNVVVIDEVHNFVREIINESAPANIFYNWIVNAEDIKIVFLSGTPIINRPAEIAILFNMLRGSLLVFDFTLVSDKDEIDIQDELREYFYKEESSIEQIHTSKKKGKTIISFTKTKTNFESIMEDGVIKTIKYNDHDLKSFFDEIFEGLDKIFDKKNITPNKSQINELMNTGMKITLPNGKTSKRSIKDLKLGNQIIFDEDINIPFNRKQKLFEINENDGLLDLSNNENFLEYFLDDNFNIIPKKKIFLRRMIMGLTSYYPIDRKSIKNMPQVVKPEYSMERYEGYTIVGDTNIVSCPMSPIQWVNYENEYVKEKLRRLNQMRKKNLYNDKENSDYSIRTRQNCNIIYDDDSFRKSDDEQQRQEAYNRMRLNGYFSYDGLLELYSPKFYRIMKNIQKFINKDEEPTGKVLYYSDFRKDAGSEAFENILLANGYEKYENDEKNIDTLVQEKSKKKRYTFLTGEESQELRKFNKEAFNHPENYDGKYIQIILISSAGAEGISLKCVRQVHIMEPFWNYIRVDQVFGRAIRMGSHMVPQLTDKDRNVEQYLYLSTLPEGKTIEEIFTELKDKNWPELEDIEDGPDIKLRLLDKHKAVYKNLMKIISMKKETNNRSVDQLLFDIMERKNIISSNIIDIIKESSVDCIQNSRDDIQLNNKCLRFSDKLKKEESHFPGITSSELNQIDVKQFKGNFLYYIKPDTYVVLAKKKDTKRDLYVYYKVDYDGEKDIDVRYIRENGLQVCDFDPIRKIFMYYEMKEHPLNKQLGNKFSVFQTNYKPKESILKNIRKEKFPSLKEIKNEDNLSSYIIKYNISEKLFYSPKTDSNIIKLYDYKQYISNNYSTKHINYIIMRDGKFFKNID